MHGFRVLRWVVVMMAHLQGFLRNESGATAIEYGLIAGLIGVVILIVLGTIGTKVNGKFGRVSNALN